MDIMSIFYNLTSNDLVNLVNMSGFLLFIYDPSLVPMVYTVLTGNHFSLTKMSHTDVHTDVHTESMISWYLCYVCDVSLKL